MSLPALPSLSSFLQASQPATHQDALGNIFDANGNHIGVVPGSIADIGTVGNRNAATSQSSSGVPTTNASPTTANDYIDKIKQYLDSLTQGDPGAQGGSHLLEDAIFIVLGLLLFAAAIFALVFTFKQTQSAVKTITGKARGALDAKVAEALLA